MKIILFAIMLISLGGLLAAEKGHEGHDHGDHYDKGPHGGAIYKLGKIGEIEFNHDEGKGLVHIYVFKKGLKEKLLLSRAPRLNVTLEKGRKQVKTKAIDGKDESSSFTATHDVLKGHAEMVVSIKMDGKSYVIKVDHAHEDHDHDHDEHKGHGHK